MQKTWPKTWSKNLAKNLVQKIKDTSGTLISDVFFNLLHPVEDPGAQREGTQTLNFYIGFTNGIFEKFVSTFSIIFFHEGVGVQRGEVNSPKGRGFMNGRFF